MNILVTGGAGYIGSHAVRRLVDENHSVTVIDHLGTGHRAAVDPRAEWIHGDTGNLALLKELFTKNKIELVMHFAAYIEVAESVTHPEKYLQNNYLNSRVLLQAMRESGVKKIIFSSTAAVYGNPELLPVEESADLIPLNPYGQSKHLSEQALIAEANESGVAAMIFRYFNVAGAHPDGSLGEDHRPESHLIPRILQAALENSEIKIFGEDYETPDGTCVRDYVHVMDIVEAHCLGVTALEPGQVRIYNLGSENGFSVREVIRACEAVVGKKIKTSVCPRRHGDSPSLVASSKLVRKQLGWKPAYPDLEMMVRHAYQWHKLHPKGY